MGKQVGASTPQKYTPTERITRTPDGGTSVNWSVHTSDHIPMDPHPWQKPREAQRSRRKGARN
jgi:hypothetical protein